MNDLQKSALQFATRRILKLPPVQIVPIPGKQPEPTQLEELCTLSSQLLPGGNLDYKEVARIVRESSPYELSEQDTARVIAEIETTLTRELVEKKSIFLHYLIIVVAMAMILWLIQTSNYSYLFEKYSLDLPRALIYTLHFLPLLLLLFIHARIISSVKYTGSYHWITYLHLFAFLFLFMQVADPGGRPLYASLQMVLFGAALLFAIFSTFSIGKASNWFGGNLLEAESRCTASSRLEVDRNASYRSGQMVMSFVIISYLLLFILSVINLVNA